MKTQERNKLVMVPGESRTTRQHDGSLEDAICPVCGFLCSGKGGFGCIDKPLMLKNRKFKQFTKPEK